MGSMMDFITTVIALFLAVIVWGIFLTAGIWALNVLGLGLCYTFENYLALMVLCALTRTTIQHKK